MPPEDDDQFDADSRDETEVEGLGPAGKAALDAERKARKEAERKARELEKRSNEALSTLRSERFARYKAQHSWLEESDLEGIELDSWDARIARLAAIAGQQQDPNAEQTIPANEQAELSRFSDRAGGAVGAKSQEQLTAKQAHERYTSGEWTLADYMNFMRAQPLPSRR